MKKLFTAILIVLFPIMVWAGEKNLDISWEYDNSTIADVAGFNIYHSTSPMSSDNCSTVGTLLDTILYVPGQLVYTEPPILFTSPDGAETIWYFGMTAYDDETIPNVSGCSNVEIDTIDFLAPSIPINFLVVITDVP